MLTVPEEKLYYIYLDTKIEGAVEQLLHYFQAQVFTKDACISILCKYYKEIFSNFSKLFDSLGLDYKFIRKQSDIKLIKGKTIFYLFNAQSNCKMVAYKELTHIFVTHGESHKSASVKPIIRIYDYIVTSGQVGIDRYLKSGIFNEMDVSNGRLLKLGDTFIGSNDFIYSENSRSIVYAPTWEGGIPSEDYSSISIFNISKIVDFCNEQKINHIFLKPHPNLGHRVRNKNKEIDSMVEGFLKSEIDVSIIKNKKSVLSKILNSLKLKQKVKSPPHYVKFALTDISAMEIQFISKNIPCFVFINKTNKNDLKIPVVLSDHYKNSFIDENKKINSQYVISDDVSKYLIDFEIASLREKSFSDRLSWLCYHCNQHKESYMKKLNNSY